MLWIHIYRQIKGVKTVNYYVIPKRKRQSICDSTCSFKIFGNSLERWGKKFIGPKEVKKLLDGEDVIVHMYSYQKKVEYKKYITLDETYGVSVLWELDVEEEESAMIAMFVGRSTLIFVLVLPTLFETAILLRPNNCCPTCRLDCFGD